MIGSGFGGLAMAIRLQAKGYRVTVFDNRDKPGGRAYTYEQDGFTFDAGPTVVTAPECLEELFALSGRRMEDYVTLKPVDPFYRLHWEDGDTFDYCRDDARLMAQFAQRSPEDAEGYRRYLSYAEDVYAAGYEKLCHVPFLRFWDMVRVSPQLIKLEAYRSVYGVVKSFVKDEHLRQALSFNSLLIGGNPYRASSIYTLIHPLERKGGVWFPRGGTGALVRALVKLLQDMGGDVRLATPVERIETRDGRVTGLTCGGRHSDFDLVVSNADVTYTYRTLLGHETRVAGRAKRLTCMRHSMSLFLVYFGTKRVFPVAQHSIYFGPRYKGLLTDIFDKGRLPEDFSLYVHAPSNDEGHFAPPGCQAFYALAPVPNLAKGDLDWEKAGEAYADRILDYLDRRYMPGLRESIVTRRVFTPQGFQTELNAHHGSAFSLEPTLTQSAWFRVQNRDPDIAGLYFVGAGTHPGAGIPGVIGSAKATDSIIPPAAWATHGDARAGVSEWAGPWRGAVTP